MSPGRGIEKFLLGILSEKWNSWVKKYVYLCKMVWYYVPKWLFQLMLPPAITTAGGRGPLASSPVPEPKYLLLMSLLLTPWCTTSLLSRGPFQKQREPCALRGSSSDGWHPGASPGEMQQGCQGWKSGDWFLKHKRLQGPLMGCSFFMNSEAPVPLGAFWPVLSNNSCVWLS